MKRFMSILVVILMVLGGNLISNLAFAHVPPPHSYGYGPAYYRQMPYHHHHHYRRDRWYDFLGYIPPISINYQRGPEYVNVSTYNRPTAVPQVIYSDYYYDCSTYNYINCNDPHYQRCFQCRGTR